MLLRKQGETKVAMTRNAETDYDPRITAASKLETAAQTLRSIAVVSSECNTEGVTLGMPD